MDDRNFFNKLAPTWDENEVRSTSSRVNHILEQLDIKDGQSVLDLGTGTGVLLPYIAQRIGANGKITAIDYSEGMLDLARRKFEDLIPQPVFLNLDFENENIEGEYDLIMLYCVYPHLHNPVETVKWLMNVNLKPDGKIAIAFPSNEKFINNIHKEKHSESGALPSAESLTDFFCSNNLNAKTVEATEDAYIITIKR